MNSFSFDFVQNYFCNYRCIYLRNDQFIRLVEMLFSLLFTERRNILGEDLIYVGKHHKGYDFVRGLLEGTDEESTTTFVLDHTYFHGITGNVLPSPICVEVGGYVSLSKFDSQSKEHQNKPKNSEFSNERIIELIKLIKSSSTDSFVIDWSRTTCQLELGIEKQISCNSIRIDLNWIELTVLIILFFSDRYRLPFKVWTTYSTATLLGKKSTRFNQ